MRRKTLKSRDPRHGTVNGYAYHQCRCDRCRAASKQYRSALEPVITTHGAGGYGSGCRCEICSSSKARANAGSYAKAKRRAVLPRVDLSSLA